jgi:hypothetical protein
MESPHCSNDYSGGVLCAFWPNLFKCYFTNDDQMECYAAKTTGPKVNQAISIRDFRDLYSTQVHLFGCFHFPSVFLF